MTRDEPRLEQWRITLMIRTAEGERPDKWDYTTLLDLAPDDGEMALVDEAELLRTATRRELAA